MQLDFQCVIDGLLAASETFGDVGYLHALRSQAPGRFWIDLSFCRGPFELLTFLPTHGQALGSPGRNARPDAFVYVLPLHLGDTEQNGGHDLPHSPAQIQLFLQGDNTYSALTPITEEADAVFHVPGQAVQLPDDDRPN